MAIHYKSTAAGNPYTFAGRVVNYDRKTVLNIQTHDFLTQGQPKIFISNRYLYAMRTVAVNGGLFNQAFIINGDRLIQYSSYYSTLNTYDKVILRNTDLNKLYIVYKRWNVGVYTLDKEIITSDNIKFNYNIHQTLFGSSRPVTDATLQQTRNNGWFLQATLSGQKIFQYAKFDFPNSQIRRSKILSSTYSTKATSVEKSCLVLHDSFGSGKIQVWDLSVNNPFSAKKDITSKLNISNIADIKIELIDSCSALRIDGKFYHFQVLNSDYQEDTIQPANASVAYPTFSSNGIYMVSNTGIFKYTPKNISSSTAGKYTLERNDSYYDNKQLFLDGNNFIIWSWDNTTATSYRWKIQVNYKGATGQMRKIDQIMGTSTSFPSLTISPKLSKFIVSGLLEGSAPFYKARTINWSLKTSKQIILPQQITSVANSLAIIQQLLYVKNINANSQTQQRKQYIYIIQGTMLFSAINQIVYPNFITPEHTRTSLFMNPDTKIVEIYYHYPYISSGIINIWRDQRKTITDYIYANKMLPYDYQFSYTAQYTTNIVHSEDTFGKFIWIDNKFYARYLQYIPSAANKANTVTAATPLVSGYIVKTASPSRNCLVAKNTASFKIFSVNTTANPLTITQVADVYSTFVPSLISNQNSFDANIQLALAISDNCQKIKINTYLYVKNNANTYINNVKGSAMDMAGAYDKNLNFFYSDSKIYKWNTNTSDYDIIVPSITGLKSTVTLYPSRDQKRLLIFSQQSNGAAYVPAIKYYMQLNNTWTSMALPNFTASYLGQAKFYVSADFQTFGFSYLLTVSTFGGSFYNIVYNANNTIQVKTITIPSQWSNQIYQSNPLIRLGERYAYYRSNKANDGNIRSQRIYKIDKTINKFIQINRKDLSKKDSQNITNSKLKNVDLYQANNSLSVLYQIQFNNIITIVKRNIGTTETQDLLNRVDGNLAVINNTIYPCIPGCKLCNDPQNCLDCKPGFVIDIDYKCSKCKVVGCGVCFDNIVTICTTCLPGRYKDSPQVCLQCDSSCLTCTASGNNFCSSCKIGTYLSGNSCLACPSNCDTCSSGTTCTKCRTGFVWDSTYNSNAGGCVACITGCAQCNPTKLWQCDTVLNSCPQGFQPKLVNNTNTGCLACPAYCKACSSGICSACRDNYVLSNGKCNQKCKSPCQTCSQGASSQCNSCINGYALNGNSCIPDVSCNNNNNCVVCPAEYNLIFSTCVKCDAGPNCETCSSTSITTCVSCLRGYYLDVSTGLCSSCAIGCSMCNDNTTCIQCSDGYILPGVTTDSTQINGKCIKCDASCASCYLNTYTCLVCAKGYTRNGYICQGDNKIKFQIKLDINIAAVTNTNLMNLKKKYADVCGKTQADVAIISVVSGSVVAQGSVTASSSDSLAKMASAISAAVTSGTTIDGLTVIGSSSTAISSSGQLSATNQAAYYKNLVIIIGIIVPIGLIIIFIVIIVFIKKGKIRNDEIIDRRVRQMSTVQILYKQKQSSKSKQGKQTQNIILSSRK